MMATEWSTAGAPMKIEWEKCAEVHVWLLRQEVTAYWRRSVKMEGGELLSRIGCSRNG